MTKGHDAATTICDSLQLTSTTDLATPTKDRAMEVDLVVAAHGIRCNSTVLNAIKVVRTPTKNWLGGLKPTREEMFQITP